MHHTELLGIGQYQKNIFYGIVINYLGTVEPRISIIQTLYYLNTISNFKIPKRDLIFCKTR